LAMIAASTWTALSSNSMTDMITRRCGHRVRVWLLDHGCYYSSVLEPPEPKNSCSASNEACCRGHQLRHRLFEIERRLRRDLSCVQLPHYRAIGPA
jgi:hypothetical protein